MRSLRARLVLLTLLVAAIAVAGVALLSRLAVRLEYTRLETSDRDARLPGVAAVLGAQVADGTPRAEVDARLAALARAPGPAAGPARPGRPRARRRPRPSLAGASFAVAGERLTIEMRGRRGRACARWCSWARRTSRSRMPRAGRVGHAVRAAAGRATPRPEPRFVATVNRWLLLSALAAVALALALSLPLSRRILGPVEAITAAARRMEAGDLAQRVPATSADEIGDLARAFNAMADAVARSESLRRALVADVAHELRTPLTNLRCQIEAVQDGLQPADAATLRSLHEETLLLARLVGDLQDLALAESGQLPLHRAPVAAGGGGGAPRWPRSAPSPARAASRSQADVPAGAGRGRGPRAAGPGPAQPARERAHPHAGRRDDPRLRARRGGPGRRWRWRTAARASPPSTCPTSSTASTAPTRRARGATGGAGLGLAIVKQLVEAHGGQVSVASEPGAGRALHLHPPGFTGSSRAPRIPSVSRRRCDAPPDMEDLDATVPCRARCRCRVAARRRRPGEAAAKTDAEIVAAPRRAPEGAGRRGRVLGRRPRWPRAIRSCSGTPSGWRRARPARPTRRTRSSTSAPSTRPSRGWPSSSSPRRASSP